MARNTSSVQQEEQEEDASAGLHCKIWVLRVSIHCQGCKRKVTKILSAIHGVYAVTVDMKQQRATVTGDVEAETLIRKLSNKGKKASICDDRNSSNDPKNCKANLEGNREEAKSSQKKKKKKEQKESQNRGTQEEEAKAVVIPAAAENSSQKTQTVAKDSPGNHVSGEKKRREGKNKAENENKAQHDCNVDPNSASTSVPPFSASGCGRYQQMGTNQVVPSPYLYQPQQFYYFPAAVNAPSPPYFLYPQQQAYPLGNPYQLPPPSLGLDSSLQLFSDENVNGCSVM